MSDWQQSKVGPGESARWLARDGLQLLATLRDEKREKTSSGFDFDLLIVGSGYGGAIAAAGLAGRVDGRNKNRPLRIGLIERGREYLPGSFPSRMVDLPTAVRGSFGGTTRGGEGLFDLRVGGDVNVVLANGLGGGSLINAGVMEQPTPEIFTDRWPKSWRDPAHRQRFYELAMERLGAASRSDKGLQRNTLGRPTAGFMEKTKRLAELADGETAPFEPAALTIALEDGPSTAQVALSACKRCGDCATGCNYAAKQSLDTNLLVEAQHKSVEIYCGLTVLKLERHGNNGWRLALTPTDEVLRAREGEPAWVSAQRVVLAAGSLGSTEILLRSQRDAPADRPLLFSGLLGQRFSGNGDGIAFGYHHAEPAEAFADEDEPPAERKVGPTITGLIRSTAEVQGQAVPIVIEEMAIPGPIRRFTEEMVTTAATLHALDSRDKNHHASGHPEADPFAVQREHIRRTSVFAVMGDDGAGGVLQLCEPDDKPNGGDGHVQVLWPEAPKSELPKAQHKHLAELAKKLGGGVKLIPNPMWSPLPEKMDPLIRGARGPLLTVHPLGGCSLGATVATGVVNAAGCVFDAGGKTPQSVHQGLMVLDGAIVPGALGINPALTIAALAYDAVEQWLTDWKWLRETDLKPPAQARPMVANIEAEIIARNTHDQRQTKAEFSERLTGPVRLRNLQGVDEDCVAELTLSYEELELNKLFRPNAQGQMSGAVLHLSKENAAGPKSKGLLSIYRASDWQANRDRPPNHAWRDPANSPALCFAVTGELTVLQREASAPLARIWRGLHAWLVQRGLRDLVQEFAERRARRRQGFSSPPLKPLSRIGNFIALASRAGEVRLFDYDLTIVRQLDQPLHESRFVPLKPLVEGKIKGSKRITYTRLGNPWRQLMELPLKDFPGLAPCAPAPKLVLDPAYFASQGAPLWQITQQREHLEALADAASLMAYFARMLISIHLWSARKPEQPRQRRIERLPGELPGLPPPELHWLEVDRLRDQPVQIRLARYRSQAVIERRVEAREIPVVMIHGYSASGTSFAHPSLKPGLAAQLALDDHDVWVLDLRSSCGLPSAREPWTFERIALQDIPAAIDYVCFKSGARKVDVVAHCMGAAMFGMAVLSAREPFKEMLSGRETERGMSVIDRHASARWRLPRRVRRAVLSQVGPVMVMTPENTFRAYLTSYFGQVLGSVGYAFRADGDEGLAMEVLDRVLGTVPYPDEELALEIPRWPWAKRRYLGSRHRMDALYGRTFKLANTSDEVLDHLDDFFGPLNLDTVSQVMHFAELRTITNRGGRNRFVTHDNLKRHWKFPTLSLHGSENGLADSATLLAMQRVMGDAGVLYESQLLEGRGHQDTLIGKDVAEGFAHISRFLQEEGKTQRDRLSNQRGEGEKPQKHQFTACAAALGPMIYAPAPQRPDSTDKDGWHLGLGSAAELSSPIAVLLWPTQRVGEGWQPKRAKLCVRPVPRHAAADWFALQLPAWARDGSEGHVILLLLYAQPKSLQTPVADVIGTAAAARPPPPGTWSQPGADNALEPLSFIGFEGFDKEVPLVQQLEQLLSETAMGVPAEAEEPGHQDHRSLRKVVKEALDEIAADPRPFALLRLPTPPPEAVSTLRLALGSCQYPQGILDGPVAHESWQWLDSALQSPDFEPADLLVLAGDQVYTDATAGLFDPTQADDRYRRPYEKWLANGQVRRVLSQVPVLAVLDDHELLDNWQALAPNTAENREQMKRRERGIAAFRRYQRGVNIDADVLLPTTWGATTARGLPVFVADTRSDRSERDSQQFAQAQLMLDSQREALMAWLPKQQPELPKIILAPSLLLPRHRRAVPAHLAHGQQDANEATTLRDDGWGGYPATLYPLLALIAREEIHHIVLLSGDEHLGMHTRITLTAPGRSPVVVQSLHAPGLYTPYRFANAKPADFVLAETFHFGNGALDHQCEVSTAVFDQPGFLLVKLHPAEDGWRLQATTTAGRGQRVVDVRL